MVCLVDGSFIFIVVALQYINNAAFLSVSCGLKSFLLWFDSIFCCKRWSSLDRKSVV